eukprot:scaffold5696_cov119-Isochrysis_galbana.AAC.4
MGSRCSAPSVASFSNLYLARATATSASDGNAAACSNNLVHEVLWRDRLRNRTKSSATSAAASSASSAAASRSRAMAKSMCEPCEKSTSQSCAVADGSMSAQNKHKNHRTPMSVVGTSRALKWAASLGKRCGKKTSNAMCWSMYTPCSSSVKYPGGRKSSTIIARQQKALSSGKCCKSIAAMKDMPWQ